MFAVRFHFPACLIRLSLWNDRSADKGDQDFSCQGQKLKLSVLKCCFEENSLCTDKARKGKILFTLHVSHPILKLVRIVKTCRSMQDAGILFKPNPRNFALPWMFFTSPNPPSPSPPPAITFTFLIIRPQDLLQLLRDFACRNFNTVKFRK